MSLRWVNEWLRGSSPLLQGIKREGIKRKRGKLSHPYGQLKAKTHEAIKLRKYEYMEKTLVPVRELQQRPNTN